MEEMVKKVLIMLLGGGLVVVLSLPALAVGSVELHKLTASDAAAGDRFGNSVAISGSTALVGARLDDDAGEDSGSAYLYDFTDPNNIIETKLTASDAAAFDQFGKFVAISGSTALVGAWGNDDAGTNSGSAYLFDVATGVQLFKLTASDAADGDGFGWSVALSSATALVGAPGNGDAGTNSGSAYLYDFSDPCNITEIKLTASDAATEDYFGSSVAISASTAIVGAHLDDDAGDASGSAYLYDFSDPCSVIETKLTASDAAADDRFGGSVALSGTTAIVGAPFDDDACDRSGSAYLYDFSDPCNITETKLTASDAAADDWFGDSVAISGATALVGALWGDAVAGSGDNPGSAYLYDFSDPCNITETKLTASDAAAVDNFGSSAAISGTTAIVGAPDDDDAGTSSGSAYLFRFGFCLFPPAGDLNKDCRVNFVDLGMMCDQWLLELIPADVAPDGGDGFVNFLDWAIFADGWQTTIGFDDLADFADQWLKTGSNDLIADIAPPADGDGIVNMRDFAALANNWLQ
jgi:hypothetical protein